MGAHGSDAPNVRDDLARVRAEVDRGNTDLRALGFWRVVARVKRDPDLIEELADEIGAIDRKAFEAHFKIRPPVWLGNAVLLAGVLVFSGLVGLVILQSNDFTTFVCFCGRVLTSEYHPSRNLAQGLYIVAAAGGLSVVVHDPAHWLVGRIGGIRFSSYFLDGPFRIQPGIKTDYATYLRAAPGKRARMHAAGAVASKLAPFAVLALVGVERHYMTAPLIPGWSLWAVLAIGVVQILTDVAWSTKRSDWKRYSREKRLARELGRRLRVRSPG